MRSEPRRKIKEGRDAAPYETERQEFCFPDGLLGFSSVKRFLLSPFRPPDGSRSPFLILRETDGRFSFPLIRPELVISEYRIDTAPEVLAQIGARSAADVVILAIVTLKDRPEAITVNLAGPLLLNPSRSFGIQIVSDHYPVRYPLLKAAPVPKIRL